MSSDYGSGYDSDGDKGGDRSLERAQKYATFGKNNSKTPDEEKEEGHIQASDDMDAGLHSKEEFVKFRLANMDEFLEAKKKQHICVFIQKIARKPIHRDPNGKAIGRGSFWQRQPFDYSNRERDLHKTHPDRICTQDLAFSDCTKRCAKYDVSVDIRDPDRERDSDWEVRTGVKMITREITFANLSNNKMLELAEANSSSRKG